VDRDGTGFRGEQRELEVQWALAEPEGEAQLLDGAAREPVGDLLGGEVFAWCARGQRRGDPRARTKE